MSETSVAALRRWARERELRGEYGFSKAWTFAALKTGKIRGKKIDGVLLIDLDTVRALIEQAPDWTPTTKRSA